MVNVKITARTELGEFIIETTKPINNTYILKEAVSNYCERKYGVSPIFIVLEAHNFTIWDKVKRGANKLGASIGTRPFNNDRIERTQNKLQSKTQERLGKNEALKVFDNILKNWREESSKIKSELMVYAWRYETLKKVARCLDKYFKVKFFSIIEKHDNISFTKAFLTTLINQVVNKLELEGTTIGQIRKWKEGKDNRFTLKKNEKYLKPLAKEILVVIEKNWKKFLSIFNIMFKYHPELSLEEILKERILNQFGDKLGEEDYRTKDKMAEIITKMILPNIKSRLQDIK